MIKSNSAQEFYNMLINDNIISEESEDDDVLAYLLIIGVMCNGAYKEKVVDWLNESTDILQKCGTNKLDTFWINLENNGVIKDGIMYAEFEEGYETTELILLSLIARGFVERVTEEIENL